MVGFEVGKKERRGISSRHAGVEKNPTGVRFDAPEVVLHEGQRQGLQLSWPTGPGDPDLGRFLLEQREVDLSEVIAVVEQFVGTEL